MKAAATAFVLAALAVATPGSAQTSAPLLPAHVHHAVSTTDAAAQAAFDRGLALAYAFSIGEARIAFRAAGASDPALAMAPWGEALVETIDINDAQTGDGDKRGAAAIAEARKREAGASPQERALIEALALRYSGRGTNAQRFRAYADAMTRLAADSADADVLALAAYAQWNAEGTFVLPDGAPTPAAQTMVRELDASVGADPANLGARHLRIHLSEMIGHPERALGDARYFDALAFGPGMSHLPHMAGHIYARLGDYPALVASNRRALANDAAYFALGSGEGQAYTRTYHNHDLEFVLYGLTTQGLDADARAALAGENTSEQLHCALRTHDDASALKIVLGPGTFPAPLRAIALARNGRLDEARALLHPRDGSAFDRARTAVAMASIARIAGHLDASAAAYRQALTLLGEEPGDPKNLWYVPAGEGLGAVLLQAGRYADAEIVFRSELVRFPNDPRLAFGLAEALEAQGHDAAAERAVIAREWHGARSLRRADLG
jgi:tetratricopeptide (TPR) repeat protein